jgi:DNA-binding NtrC family response regulator
MLKGGFDALWVVCPIPRCLNLATRKRHRGTLPFMPVSVSELPTSGLEASADGPFIKVRAAHIEIIDGPDRGARARVDRATTFIVGSGPRADMRLTDTTVSREHLRLTVREGGVHVRDTGSRNGTELGGVIVNDIVITQDAALRLGGTTLKVHVEASPTELPISRQTAFGNAIGHSAAMRHVFSLLETASTSDVSVLLEGESGVGKEVLAHAIHDASNRRRNPFVIVDCASMPPALVESELFGHVRGAFTGADQTRIGACQQADGGTLFFDEIGELPLEVQPKFLRFLETREVRPLGARASRRVDVRIVAATNRNLAAAARVNEFRPDLFYRLAVVRLTIPPLRDRREDIVPLALHLLRSIPGHENNNLDADFGSMLTAYDWPGNIRELRNAVDRYVVMGARAALENDFGSAVKALEASQDLSHLPYHEAKRIAVEQFERMYVTALLTRTNGVITEAALMGEVSRASLHRMLTRQRGGSSEPE